MHTSSEHAYVVSFQGHSKLHVSPNYFPQSKNEISDLMEIWSQVCELSL